MYSYAHIVCWVIILGLTCRVEIPRLGICFITVLTRLCLSTLVLVNARGVNPILVIYSISICQSWCIPAGAEQIADQIEMAIWKFVCCHFVSSGILIIQIPTTLITTDCRRSSSCQQKGNWFSIAETSSFLTSLYVMCPAA